MSRKSLDSLIQMHLNTMKESDQVIRSCPWENPHFYANWCGQSYYFVAHATRILAASAARLHLDRDEVHMRFLDHAQEEKHHEKLYVQDLKELGWDIHAIPEHPLTASLYQCQYFLLDQMDPIAPMGGVFYLEGVSVYSGTELMDRCLKAHGAKACRFLKVHVHEDQEHLKKAEKILGGLNDEELQVVSLSYRQFSYFYLQLLKELQLLTGAAKKTA